MPNRARDLHRVLDRQFAEACARDSDPASQIVDAGSTPSAVCDGAEVASQIADATNLYRTSYRFPDLARPIRWRRDLIVSRPSEPRVLLMRLSQRKSGKGRPYLSGWLGKARVVAFEGAEDQYGNATWDLYVAEPRETEDKPRPAAKA